MESLRLLEFASSEHCDRVLRADRRREEADRRRALTVNAVPAVVVVSVAETPARWADVCASDDSDPVAAGQRSPAGRAAKDRPAER